MSNRDSITDSILGSTLHDRARRKERNVQKIDQLRIRRYGMCEPSKKGRLKYTMAGYVLIFDPKLNKALTSWMEDDAYDRTIRSGTRFTDPIILSKSKDHDKKHVIEQRDKLKHIIQSNKHKWKTHTVIIVDMSGSMRKDDVDGARCRSDGVWLCLARDLVKEQLENQTGGMYDLVSVVVMNDEAETVLFCEPIDYVLYNKFIDMREWSTIKPRGPGNYRPALSKAEELLNINKLGSCTPSLFFFSDGKPSDRVKEGLASAMGDIASRFGRRLTLTCVGMAANNEDFSILRDMVKEAKEYGAISSFNKPSLSAASLSQVIQSHVSTSSNSRLETIDSSTGRVRTVRTDFSREKENTPDDLTLNENWRVFRANAADRYTQRVWVWHAKNGDFSELIDPRCLFCYAVVADDKWNLKNRGQMCDVCKVCFFCKACSSSDLLQEHRTSGACEEFAKDRRNGCFVKRSIPSFGVAWKNRVFGEGKERIAYKFRFLDEKDNFIGPVMVAKESKYVEDLSHEEKDNVDYLRSHRHTYHTQFVKTQALAARFASIFNETLNSLTDRFGRNERERLLKMPRIRFLEPLIFELFDSVDRKTHNVLVEPKLEGKYKKYNDNFGGLTITSKEDEFDDIDKRTASFLMGRKATNIQEEKTGFQVLGAINEEEEEEDHDDDNEDDDENEYSRKGVEDEDSITSEECATGDSGVEEFFDHLIVKGDRDSEHELTRNHITDRSFVDAFSHFSYVRSGGNIMVVDLQGVLQKHIDGSREFVFTDPAIHKRKRHQFGRPNRVLKKLDFGRTDCGKAGIDAFFATHECNGACRLLGLRPRADFIELKKENI